jgi:hypothetical protein
LISAAAFRIGTAHTDQHSANRLPGSPARNRPQTIVPGKRQHTMQLPSRMNSRTPAASRRHTRAHAGHTLVHTSHEITRQHSILSQSLNQAPARAMPKQSHRRNTRHTHQAADQNTGDQNTGFRHIGQRQPPRSWFRPEPHDFPQPGKISAQDRPQPDCPTQDQDPHQNRKPRRRSRGQIYRPAHQQTHRIPHPFRCRSRRAAQHTASNAPASSATRFARPLHHVQHPSPRIAPLNGPISGQTPILLFQLLRSQFLRSQFLRSQPAGCPSKSSLKIVPIDGLIEAVRSCSKLSSMVR